MGCRSDVGLCLSATGKLALDAALADAAKGKPGVNHIKNLLEYAEIRTDADSRRCFPGVFKYPVNATTKVYIAGNQLKFLKELMGVVVEGGTALDPFLGGGTTAHAALLTGRKCIGVELSPEYAKLSAKRLQEIA